MLLYSFDCYLLLPLFFYLMEEEDKHDKPKSYTSFNRRIWIAEKFRIIKYAEESNLHAASSLFDISRKAIQYRIQQKEEIIEETNKMNTITLHHRKAAKTISFEGEILNYVLYNNALGNAVVSKEVIFKLYCMDETFRENLGVHFKKSDIVLWKDFFYLQKKCSHFLKTSRKLFRWNSWISLL